MYILFNRIAVFKVSQNMYNVFFIGRSIPRYMYKNYLKTK